MTTIDSGTPQPENLIVGEDEMATSQPAKSRKPARGEEKPGEVAELAEPQPES
ncbi:MAG: hypothetical protein AAGD47_12705 [Pseudomonadota bacterium]